METWCVTCGIYSIIEGTMIEICQCNACKTKHWIDTSKGMYFRIEDGKYGKGSKEWWELA